MDAPVTVAVIAACAAVIGSPITFWFTKRKEREAEWRSYKFDLYKELVQSMSGTVGADSTPEGNRRFAFACNSLALIASKQALEALYEFREEISVSNPRRSMDRHDVLLSRLIWHIREDLTIPGNPKIEEFKARLWTSGAPPGKT